METLPILIILFIFFLPSIIALARGRRNPGTVIVVNFFTGVTGIGWIVALAMAFGDRR